MRVVKVAVVGAGQLGPGGSAIGRFPDARPPHGIAVEEAFARAAVAHVGTRVGGHRAHRQVAQVATHVGPLIAGGGSRSNFPEAAVGRAGPHGVAGSIGGLDQQRQDTATHVIGAALGPAGVGEASGDGHALGQALQAGFIVAGGGEQALAGHGAGGGVTGAVHVLQQGQIGAVGTHAVSVIFLVFAFGLSQPAGLATAGSRQGQLEAATEQQPQ